MQIAVWNVLALMRWQGTRFFTGFQWPRLCLVADWSVAGLGVFWVVSRRRRRWL